MNNDPLSITTDINYDLRLYVAGKTLKSLLAIANLKRICETHLAEVSILNIIDLVDTPQLAAEDQIFALPTLVRRMPTPIKKIIGDLSNEERVLESLGLQLKSGDNYKKEPFNRLRI